LRLATNAATTTVVNADTLDNQLPSYYLDYNNFTNTPTNIMFSNTNNSVSGNITPASDNLYTLGSAADKWANIHSYRQNFSLSGSAERFQADSAYDDGTVVIFGGTNEVTTTTTQDDTRIAGVVSSTPAILMNCDAGTQTTHPSVVTSGRTLCKVFGTVNKGDYLVTSTNAGHAIASATPTFGTVIGRALEANVSGFGTIAIAVSLM
jgi:hypothetical protein